MEKRTIMQHRLINQLLDTTHFDTAEETVKWMGAIQGQDYSPGLWAIGLRTPNVTKEDILHSIEDKKIIRSWTMRHTIHFVAMEDLQWMIDLSRDKMVQRYKNHMKKEAGLEETTLLQSLDVFSRALEGRKLVSRPAIREVLETAGIDTSKQRLYHLLWYAAQSGLIFMGPMEGKQQTFGLVEEWSPKTQPSSREEGLCKLAVKYLESHGPASIRDFSWWSGLSQKEAKLGFHLAESTLFDTDENGQEYWCFPNREDVKVSSSSQMHLLYGLDEFLIGYKDRKLLLSEKVYAKIDPNKKRLFFPVFVEGKVIGRWKPVVKNSSLSMNYFLATDLEVPEERLVHEAERYSDFFQLSLGDVQIHHI